MFVPKVKSSISAIAILICFILVSGCCPDYEYGPNDLYNALTRYELSTFIDSAGNHEQILLTGEGTDRVIDEWNECSVEGYATFPYAEFELLHSGRRMKYEQKDGARLYMPDWTISYLWPQTWEESYVIQGREYSECVTHSYSDTVQQIYSFIIDKNYGLVMFSYRDEYRWERVLEW